jgi:hypothetical protein
VTYIEVQQQACSQAGQAKVGKDLDFMKRQQLLYGLQLDEHRAFHDQVRAVTAVEGYAFVSHWDASLPFKPKSIQCDLMTEAVTVG